MVSADAAFSRVKHTGLVVMEDSATSVDGDSHRCHCNGFFHTGRSLGLNTDIGTQVDSGGLSHVVGAFRVHSCVFPVFILVGIVVDEISVSVIGHAAVATFIDRDTCNELLLRKGYKAIASDGISALNCLSRSESPA